jgi:DNA polymerase (family 10)
MDNQDLANIFYEIAFFLEMDGVPFKPAAYEKAAIILENLEENIEEIYLRDGIDGFESMPGIGKSIAQTIEEYINTGKVRYYQSLKKKMPIDIGALDSIEGMGPRKIKVLYEKLKIKNVKDLERAAKNHEIANLFGFGPKTEENILQGIEFLKRNKGRFLFSDAIAIAQNVEKTIGKIGGVKKITIAGSLRRGKETIGDIDFLAIASNHEKVMKAFVSLPGVSKVWAQGKTKSSVRFKNGIDADLRIIPDKSFGSALQYFTGSKEHNIALRKIAIEKKLKLNEYGLFRGAKMIGGINEKTIYDSLGLDYVEPELREDHGEIESVINHNLPRLIHKQDVKGDLHCHSAWNGGENTLEELAEAAIERKYQYLGISDHTRSLKIENGLEEKDILLQIREIDRINKGFSKKRIKFKLLKGAEVNILKDGSLDISDKVLSKLDYAIGGIHSGFKMTETQNTGRMIKAMENPYITIISHPTGRIIKRRDEYSINLNKILEVAKKTKTILEINSCPDRLDLKDFNIKKAKELRVSMIINSDAHEIDQMDNIFFGVIQARRGWAEKKDIVNCLNIEKLLVRLKEKQLKI